MTACPDKAELLHGLLDNELDAAHARELEAHIATCPACAEALGELRALRALLADPALRRKAPAALRTRILADIGAVDPLHHVGKSQGRPRSRQLRRWGGAGMGVAIAASLLLLMVAPFGGDAALERELVAGHVRSLQAQHLLDVPTSDHHTVKPWFAGKLDYSPPVPELAAAGFPLQGGRLDYLAGRPVAALVYRHGAHVLNLYVWPGDGPRQPAFEARDGYNLMRWRDGGMAYWAVSDVGVEEMHAFATALAGAVAAQNPGKP
ncbi:MULTISPECIES: anti-sigma factor family protein [Nitrospirillum]|uniref:Mycothiol system anti-sigma-R factor n=1 Tax=Nitrospirillum amazonense TaxID=28077 RepID=A0A560GCW5_9PROT|nr:anti-sigma factor [Nitrospirillum amazonense]MEC4594413.1 anti-sigma factor [Nitrospirillum amazonense]TWB31756.1 mycothiol system anti-sigma-R factor [Nitrospirillum amazonense]